MERTRKRTLLNLEPQTVLELRKIVNSRNTPVGAVTRAKILLRFNEGQRIADIARGLDTNRPLVERCLDKAQAYGPLKALADLPRPGRKRKILEDAKAWVLSIACQRPADLGQAAETWTYQALIKYIREHCQAAGHDSLARVGKGRLHVILTTGNVKPHKISYYCEKRDPDFAARMADVLCVYQEVALINTEPAAERASVTISYDEKPGLQAIQNIAAQLPPVPGQHPTIGRDAEYKRLGTVSLLAGIDLHTGEVIPLVKERHRSREFIEFLGLVDDHYPADWRIRLVLDNHSAHVSKETRAYLLTKPGRFEFVFTPKHGSWLNLIEMFFSKVARSFLRHIRVASKQELIDRIYLGIQEINREPVVFRWKYKLSEISASL
jgi:transposase